MKHVTAEEKYIWIHSHFKMPVVTPIETPLSL